MFEVCLFNFWNNIPRFKKYLGSFDKEFETTAFPDLKCLPAFRRHDGLAVPMDIEGTDEQWSAFKDCDGKIWWYLSKYIDDSETGSYRWSEIYRTAGFIPISWSDNSTFVLKVECQPFTHESLNRLYSDFTSSFMRIILSANNLLTTGVTYADSGESKTLFSIEALENLVRALEIVTNALKSRLALNVVQMPKRQAKKSSATLLSIVQNQNSQIVASREVRHELNTCENQFVHSVIKRALKIIELSEIFNSDQSMQLLDCSNLNRVKECITSLKRCLLVFDNLKIGTSAQHFNFLVFQQDPWYSRFYRAQKAFFKSGIGYNELVYAFDYLNRLKVKHLSQIYERWCLIVIIRVLEEKFKFHPAEGYLDYFVRKIIDDEHNIEVVFHHEQLRYRIQLGYEHELSINYSTGRRFRPDFVLQLVDPINPTKKFPKLVLDAKFRTTFEVRECRKLLNELADDKKYTEGNVNLLYLLYPTSESDRPSYFGLMNNYKGWVHLFPDDNHSPTENNIACLVIAWLQYLESKFANLNEKICPNCGTGGSLLKESYGNYGNQPIQKVCCSICGHTRYKTYCANCGHYPIFVNYLPDYYQKTEFGHKPICPECACPVIG